MNAKLGLTLITGASALLGCDNRPEFATVGDRPASNHVVESEVTCSSCAIDVDTLVTLSNVNALPGAFGRSDVTGIVYLVDRTDEVVKAFGADGQLLGTIGRRGGGPGEYEQVRNLLVGADGAIHILDGVLGRHTVYSPSGELLSTTRVEITPGLLKPAVLQANGRILVNTSDEAGASSRTTIDLIDTSGAVIRSADSVAAGAGASSWHRERALWLRSNGEVLVGQRYSPTVTVYSPELTPIGSITRVMEWFPALAPGASPGDGVFDKPMSPVLNALWEDSAGRLWLHFIAPSPAWKPMSRPADFKPEDYVALAARPRAQAIVEVLDADHRRVLARMHFDGGLGESFGAGLIADYLAHDSAGEPEVRVLRLSLRE